MKRREMLWGLPVAAVATWLARHFGSSAQADAPKARAIPRRKLGRTGELVSMVGLGGYHIGVQGDPKSDDVRAQEGNAQVGSVDDGATGLAHVEQPRGLAEPTHVRVRLNGQSDIPDTMWPQGRSRGVQRRRIG